jgi:outer membrane protein assembly factor BamA
MHRKKFSFFNFQPACRTGRFSILLIGCLFMAATSRAQYQLHVQYIDKDSLFHPQQLGLQTNFPDKMSCMQYVFQLPEQLHKRGYTAASVDSLVFDSAAATILLYHGNMERWAAILPDSVDKKALDESGFNSKNFIHKPVDIEQVKLMEQRLLSFYEKNGYPFASVYLDSIISRRDGLNALLKVNKGPLYHIDSIRVYGNAVISNIFLQRYLNIQNGSLYNIDKLKQTDKLLLQLPYLQEVKRSNLTMLGTGSILNLYLIPKKSSQIDFLIGFSPAGSQTNSLLLTGQANLNLKNALGVGETILFNWQQLQQSSPKLNLGYQQPYVLGSPFGLDFSFSLFKKDSTYLQLNTQLGIQYLLSANQSGKIFLQDQSTVLLASGADTSEVIATKTLPPNIDANAVSVGINYDWNSTDYHFNPRSGNEVDIIASVGTKTIKENSTILSITDSAFNYASLYDSLKLHSYQFKIVLAAAHYFSTGKQSFFKAAANFGWYNSQSVFKSDLFQIGGYKLLRGFDEESIYATQYVVATAEYRYLLGLNSYLFSFIDLGWVKEDYQYINADANFLGTGIGLEFETKIGLLNVSYAIGTRSDVPFDLNEASKIHFGYINYF